MSGNVVGVCGEVGPGVELFYRDWERKTFLTGVVLLCGLRSPHQTEVLVMGRVKPEPGELLLQRGLLGWREVGEGRGGRVCRREVLWPLEGRGDRGQWGVGGGGKLGRRIVFKIAVDPMGRTGFLLHLALGEKVPLSEEKGVEQLLAWLHVGILLPRILDRASLGAASPATASRLLGSRKLLVKR